MMKCGACKERHETAAEVRACYNRPAAKPQPATEGMYFYEGRVVKVQRAVHGSGQLYAKELVNGTFQMVPGLVRKITQAHRMTVEQAAEYGQLYGICVRCAAPLTDEESIARGIGPVCAGKI
jgi:hypothetical protein